MYEPEEFHALDVETKSLVDGQPQYALEPFRVRQHKATITDVSVSGCAVEVHTTNVNELERILFQLQGREVWCHNAIFDVAWCIAHGYFELVKGIKWRDTMLAAKWINNGQIAEYGINGSGRMSFSLAALVERYLSDHPLTPEFLGVKSQDIVAGENPEYWSKRVLMDAELTKCLAQKLWGIMPDSMRAGFLIEQATIAPVANSWLVGLDLDDASAQTIVPKIMKARAGIARALGVSESAITSSQQLGDLLFNKLGMPVIGRTPKGKPSASKDNLKMLHFNLSQSGDKKNADILQLIMDFKQISTLESKYIKGIHNTVEYTKDGRSHGAPRIFGTYTGRFTYSSKTLNKDKYKIGIAQHQVPRKGPTKSFIKPPEGYKLAEFDAAGQESRGMAIMSGDEAMLDVFRQNLDFHGMTGSRISGMEYNAFVSAFHEDDAFAVNQRYNGKFVNLSCNYRIGDTALRKKAFTQYDIVVDHNTAAMWNRSFKTMYPGVPQYWRDVCHKSRQRGYTETLAGRRYQLSEWTSNKWVTESSAINFPIQGFGAEMKYLAIKEIFEKYPDVIYSLDVHDANFYLLPDDRYSNELCLDIKETLNNLPYSEAWNTDIPIPLLWDAKIGDDWKSLKEVGYDG